MINWVRILFATLALAGLLAARPGIAAPAQGAVHHHCMGMMDGQDCPNDHHGAIPDCCIAAVCAMVQPAFSHQNSAPISLSFRQIALPLLNDAWHSGVRPPPDLRPPIA